MQRTNTCFIYEQQRSGYKPYRTICGPCIRFRPRVRSLGQDWTSQSIKTETSFGPIGLELSNGPHIITESHKQITYLLMSKGSTFDLITESGFYPRRNSMGSIHKKFGTKIVTTGKKFMLDFHKFYTFTRFTPQGNPLNSPPESRDSRVGG